MRQDMESSGYCSHSVLHVNWSVQEVSHHSLDAPTVRLV